MTNEPAFVSARMQIFYARLRAASILTTPYNHRALAKAESAVNVSSTIVHELPLSHTDGTVKEILPSANLMHNAKISEFNAKISESVHCCT